MRIILLPIICFFLKTITAFSQNEKPIFATVEPFKTSYLTLLPEWKPGKIFISKNPDFLVNGSYNLTIDDLGNNKKQAKYNIDYYERGNENNYAINSEEYPALLFNSQKKVNFGSAFHFLFTINESEKSTVPIGNKNWVNSEIDYSMNSDLKIKSQYLNNKFKSICENLAQKTEMQNFEVLKFAEHSNKCNTLSPSDIILDFQCNTVHLAYKHPKAIILSLLVPPALCVIPFTPNFFYFFVLKHKSDDNYPNFVVYQLQVKNAEDNVIKVYKQAIFADAKIRNYFSKNTSRIFSDFMIQAMPAALNSLMAQFLEDNETMDYIKNKYTQYSKMKKNNKDFFEQMKTIQELKYYVNKRNYKLRKLEKSKNELLKLGVKLNGDQENAILANSVNSLLVATSKNPAATSLILGLGNTWSQQSNVTLANNIMARYNEDLEKFKKNQQIEVDYIKNLSKNPASFSELTNYINRSDFFSDEYKDVFNKLNNKIK